MADKACHVVDCAPQFGLTRVRASVRQFLACFLLVTGLLLPVAGAASPIGSISKITITANAIGPKSDGCDTYVLAKEQVRAFFHKAILISGSQQHDFFMLGSCSAQGTVKTRYDTWKWEIRSLGTATITATNGEIFRLADPDQESSLEDEGREP